MPTQDLGFSSLLLNIQTQEQPKFTSELTTTGFLNGFMYHGVPFRQISQAEQIRLNFLGGHQSTTGDHCKEGYFVSEITPESYFN